MKHLTSVVLLLVPLFCGALPQINNVLKCYQCRGPNCGTTFQSTLKPCVRDVKGDSCVTDVIDKNNVIRGCKSDPNFVPTKFAAMCQVDGCNNHPMTHSAECVSCSEANSTTCARNLSPVPFGKTCTIENNNICKATALLNRPVHCFTYKASNRVVRGCAKDSWPLSLDEANYSICEGQLCNNGCVPIKCVKCDSRTNPKCASQANELKPEQCAADMACFDARTAEGAIVRGCGGMLPNAFQNVSCFADGCNIKPLPTPPSDTFDTSVKPLPPVPVESLPLAIFKRLPPGLAKRLPPGLAKRLPPGLAKRLPPGLAKRLPPWLAKRHPSAPAKYYPTAPAKRHPSTPAKYHPTVPTKRHPPVPAKRYPPTPTKPHSPALVKPHPRAPVKRHPPAPAKRHSLTPAKRHPLAPIEPHPLAPGKTHPTAPAKRLPPAPTKRPPPLPAKRHPPTPTKPHPPAPAKPHTPAPIKPLPKPHPTVPPKRHPPVPAKRHPPAPVKPLPPAPTKPLAPIVVKRECHKCDSKNLAACATNPSASLPHALCKDPQDQCVTAVVNGITHRGCQKEQILPKHAISGMCHSNLCNVKIFPENRLQCYQCQGRDCAKNFGKTKMPCVNYVKGDSCVTDVKDEHTVTRKCISDSGYSTPRLAVICKEAGCNHQAATYTAKCVACSQTDANATSCVRSNSTVATGKTCTIAQEHTCTTTVLLNRHAECFTYKAPNKVVRGCLKDAGKLALDKDNFEICQGQLCNNQCLSLPHTSGSPCKGDHCNKGTQTPSRSTEIIPCSGKNCTANTAVPANIAFNGNTNLVVINFNY